MKKKSADQLRIYCAADLHLWFCICKKPVFLWCGSKLFCFVVAICDLVHDVETIKDLSYLLYLLHSALRFFEIASKLLEKFLPK